MFTHERNTTHTSNTLTVVNEDTPNEGPTDPDLNVPVDTSTDLHVGEDDYPSEVDGTNHDDNVEATTNRTQPTSDFVSYQCIVERAGELARTCQQEQTKMRSVLCNINQMIDRVRDGHDIFIHFDTALQECEKENNALNNNQPRPAISKAIANATGIKRLQSGREFHSRKKPKHRKNVNLSQVSNSNDDTFLNAANTQTRCCSICRQKKHGRGNCPRLTKFGSVPLQKGNEQVRLTLSTGIADISRYSLVSRRPDDNRNIFKEMPALNEIKAIVLHQRFLITGLLYNNYTSDNICIETTILSHEGLEHPSYTRQLFKVDCISAYITKSKTNIIMSQLDGSNTQETSFGATESLSQNTYAQGVNTASVGPSSSQQFEVNSTLNQDRFAMMGYGVIPTPFDGSYVG